jgi:hypothetical protein
MPGRIVSVLVVALFVAAAGLLVTGQSADPWVGTWRLNIAKSKSNLRSQTVRLEAVPNGIRTFIDIVDAQGKATHNEIIATLDGKEYEMKGVAMPTTRAYKRVGRDYEFVTRVNGKVTTTSRGAVNPDGKTLTFTTTGTDSQGQPVKTVTIFERQ